MRLPLINCYETSEQCLSLTWICQGWKTQPRFLKLLQLLIIFPVKMLLPNVIYLKALGFGPCCLHVLKLIRFCVVAVAFLMKDWFHEKMWIFCHFKDFYGLFSQLFITTAYERYNIHVFTKTYPKQFIAFSMASEKASLSIRKQELFQFWLILIQNSRTVLGHATVKNNPILI